MRGSSRGSIRGSIRELDSGVDSGVEPGVEPGLDGLGVRSPGAGAVRARPRPDRGERRAEHAPDPVPELRGGGTGEGDHQDAVDRPFLLENEAGDEGGERVGLSGPGAGFDERRAAAVEGKIERRRAGSGRAGSGCNAHRPADAASFADGPRWGSPAGMAGTGWDRSDGPAAALAAPLGTRASRPHPPAAHIATRQSCLPRPPWERGRPARIRPPHSSPPASPVSRGPLGARASRPHGPEARNGRPAAGPPSAMRAGRPRSQGGRAWFVGSRRGVAGAELPAPSGRGRGRGPDGIDGVERGQ